MKITDALKGEHGVFYAQFQFIEKALDDVNLTTLQALGAMLASALAPHAQMEDEILLPPLEEKIGQDGPTGPFRSEHVQIDTMLERLQGIRDVSGAHDRIEGALARLPDAKKVEEAQQLVRDILFAARDHFAKEEHMLFPLAEEILNDGTLELLGMDWAQRRGVALR